MVLGSNGWLKAIPQSSLIQGLSLLLAFIYDWEFQYIRHVWMCLTTIDSVTTIRTFQKVVTESIVVNETKLVVF